jgi:AcrR family transcriptional regulator
MVDHEGRRREIVAAIWVLIANHGIDAVTMRAVAREAGVSVGRIQHYFASKEELVRHGCTLMLAEAVEHIGRQLEGVAPLEAVRILLHHAVPRTESFVIGTVVWWAYLIRSRHDPVIAASVRQAQADGVDRMADLVAAAQAEGAIAADHDPRKVALRLLALSEGYAARVVAGSLAAEEALDSLDAELHRLTGR